MRKSVWISEIVRTEINIKSMRDDFHFDFAKSTIQFDTGYTIYECAQNRIMVLSTFLSMNTGHTIRIGMCSEPNKYMLEPLLSC